MNHVDSSLDASVEEVKDLSPEGAVHHVCGSLIASVQEVKDLGEVFNSRLFVLVLEGAAGVLTQLHGTLVVLRV